MTQRQLAMLVKEADALFHRDRHSEVIRLIEPALRICDEEDPDRAHAEYFLGASYYFTGDLVDALMLCASAHRRTHHRADTERLAHFALLYQLQAIRWIIRISGDRDLVPVAMTVMNDHHRWLVERKKEPWTSSLLVTKAQLYSLADRHEEALDCAETACQLKLTPTSVGWRRGYHAIVLSQCIRHFGDYGRCLKILNACTERYEKSYTAIQVNTELVRVLLALGSRQLPNAVDIARGMHREVDQLTSNRTKIEALVPMAQAFVRARSYREAEETLCTVASVVASDSHPHAPYLQAEASECFRACFDRLGSDESRRARELSARLAGFRDEMKTINEVSRAAGDEKVARNQRDPIPSP